MPEKCLNIRDRNLFQKKTAVVMMADAVEASSRTLDKYNEINVGELVERIVDMQERDDQFSDAPITFQGYLGDKKHFQEKIIEYPSYKDCLSRKGSASGLAHIIYLYPLVFCWLKDKSVRFRFLLKIIIVNLQSDYDSVPSLIFQTAKA